MSRVLTIRLSAVALVAALTFGAGAQEPTVPPVKRAFYAARIAHARAGYDVEALRNARALYEGIVKGHPNTDEAAAAKEAIASIDAVLDRGRLAFTPPKFDAIRDGFLASVPEKDRAALKEAFAKAADAEGRADVARESLTDRYADFANALKAFAADRIDAATAQLEAVLKRAREAKRPYLAAAAACQLARCYVFAERYEDARPLLAALTAGGAAHTFRGADALFLLGVCEARLLNREVAVGILQRFLTVCEDMPERMAMGATQLMADLLNVRAGGLSDIAGRMDDARRRLDLSRTGEATQAQQERVVALLDRIIERIEKQQQNPDGGEGQGGGQDGESAVPGAGANESTARASGPHTGPLERVNRGSDADTWGQARQKEREEALNVLKARFPERYRELVEQYFRSLQEEQP